MPIRISPSRASDFKQCPRLYRYRVIERLPEPPTKATLHGTIVHRVLEQLFEFPPENRTIEAAKELIPKCVEEYRHEFEDIIEVADAIAELGPGALEVAISEASSFCNEMVTTYFEIEDPTTLDTVGRELKIVGKVGGATMTGIIDRLDRSPDGRYVVSDYKTGKSPKAGFEDKAFFAMRVYAALLEEYDDVGAAPDSLRLIFLKSGDVLELEVNENQLRATHAQIEALANAIERAMERDEFPPRTSPLCDWCYFKPICPAFSGVEA